MHFGATTEALKKKRHSFTLLVVDVFSQKPIFPQIWLKSFIEMNRVSYSWALKHLIQVITDDFNFCLI